MIGVRLVLDRDEDAIMDLFALHAAEFGAHLGFDPETARACLHQSLDVGSPVCFVAEEDGALLGYITGRICGYTFTTGHFVQHELLFVRPEKRGTRAAVKLIDEFIRWGSTVGAREYYLGTSTNYKADRVARLMELRGAQRVGHSLKGVY